MDYRMPKEQKIITKEDLLPLDAYSKVRRQMRKELVATLMFEIDNPIIRAEFLGKLGGVENNIFIKVGDEKIYAVPEMDVDRTSEDGKASSVQFIHFKFSDDQVNKFKDQNNSIEVGIDHKEYSHTTKFSEDNIKALSADFN